MQEACSTLVTRLRAAPRSRQELMHTALLLEGLQITADEWPHNPQLLR